MKPTNENGKNPEFNPPVKLRGVDPKEYAKDIKSGRGSAAPSGPPDYTMPGFPSKQPGK